MSHSQMISNLRTHIIFILFCLTSLVQAQDIQFSQFYASSTYLNPGLAGTKIVDRLMSHSRLQWLGLDANYVSTMLSYDRAFTKANSAIGVVMIYDQQGQNTFKTQELQFQYAYIFNPHPKVAVSTGIQLGLLQKQLNNNIIFPDQMDITGLLEGVNSADANLLQITTSPDISFGSVIFTPVAWFGFSASHMNRPRQSFLFEDNRLPTKFVFSTGYRFNFKELSHTWITPTFQYKSQGKSDQFEMGVHATFDRILTGLWYRGIPPKQLNDLRNHESLIPMIGYKISKHFQLSYSYDVVVSGLAGISAGAHELNIQYTGGLLDSHQKSLRSVICPPKLSK